MFKKLLVTLLAISLIILVACATVEKQQRTLYNSNIEIDSAVNLQQGYPKSVLRVATLNAAHARKDSFNQLFVGENSHKENLNDIANALIQHRPHIAALQEADAASRWSGNFDHVAYLASVAKYPWRAHVSNAESWLYSYGTALLSALPIIETIKHSFEPSPPTLDMRAALHNG